jgi:serine/threonine protein kinase
MTRERSAALLGCPPLEDWQALFADALPSDRRPSYERHLEACAACQYLLDRDDTSEDSLRTTGRRLGNPTIAPPNPSLIHVLTRLHEERGPTGPDFAEPADLYFLRPAERPDLLGTLGPYEVQEVIGQGGMGVVLKAYEPALHRLVAIKVMAAAVAGSATARRRFTREAQAAAAVCHENVVAVHGVHEIDGLPYLVMQYIAGESLQARLDRVGPLEPAEAVRIALQTAQGLAAAHAQGLIHRDIKPANLLLENGLARVKISDFGLARTADDIQLTQPGVVAGTPEYMAPEQARGEPVDHRADLFSLGSVLYAMCTGVPPFQGASAMAVLRQVSDAPHAPPRSRNPHVPVWLESLIDLLLGKAPGDRIPSAAEVADLLETYLSHLRMPRTVSAPPLPCPPRDHRTSKPAGIWSWARWLSTRSGLLFIVILVALGLALSWMLAGNTDSPPPPNQPFREYYHSFKNDRDLPPEFSWDGMDPQACVKFESEGLLVALPLGVPGRRMRTGLSSAFGLKGDFEITMSFEVLKEPESIDAGEGTGGYLWVDLDTPALNRALFARSVHNGKRVGLWYHLSDPTSGQRSAEDVRNYPSAAMKGQLRLARSGMDLSYLVADESSDQFRFLFKHPFGKEDVRMVRIGGFTGGRKASLDFRVTDLRIRAQAFVDLPDTAPAQGASPWRGGWLGGALMVAALLAGSLMLGVRYALRQRRAEASPLPPAGTREEQAPPEGTPAPVMFACSGCGKRLKVRTSLAGKNVRCPSCQQTVLVPSAGGSPA